MVPETVNEPTANPEQRRVQSVVKEVKHTKL
jgi:hypothetical protein